MPAPKPKIARTCLNCGQEFLAFPCRADTQRFCNGACYKEWDTKNRIHKSCEVCGKSFNVKPHRAKTARFCSQECGGKWHMMNRVMRGPDMKGNTYRKGLRPVNAFTSEQVSGQNNPSWVEPVLLTCAYCNKTIERKPWIVHQSKSKTGKAFCDNACCKAYHTGERHPLYRGGAMTYRGRSWRKSRKAAAERDNGTCQQCGKVVGSSIPVHHIKPFRLFSSEVEANALSNLISLCQSCHMQREWSSTPLPFSSSARSQS